MFYLCLLPRIQMMFHTLFNALCGKMAEDCCHRPQYCLCWHWSRSSQLYHLGNALFPCKIRRFEPPKGLVHSSLRLIWQYLVKLGLLATMRGGRSDGFAVIETVRWCNRNVRERHISLWCERVAAKDKEAQELLGTKWPTTTKWHWHEEVNNIYEDLRKTTWRWWWSFELTLEVAN